MIPDDKLKEFMPYDIAAFLENKGFEVCRNEVSDPEWNEQFQSGSRGDEVREKGVGAAWHKT